MRHLIFAITVFVASLAIAGQSALAQAPSAARPAVSERAADAVIQPYMDAQRFSGAVLVARGDQVLLRKGYGLADREWNTPVTADAVFRIGSVTKQFTAALILKLAEEGKLSLDDPVAKHYPGAPPAWEKITVRHLLDHTSGIPSYTSLPGFFQTMAMNDRKPAEIVGLTQDKPLDFEPGSKFAYNNTGYVLLGAIIETVTGKPYAEHLRTALLEPLGLKNTGYEDTRQVMPRRAKGYGLQGASLTHAPYLSMTLPYAAGSMYSTVDDLFVWARLLHGGKVLQAPSTAQMFTDRGHNYGFGQMVLKTPKLGPMLGHGGGINGFSSMLSYFPDHDLTVVVLSNFGHAPSQQIAADLARLYVEGPATPPQVAVSAEQLKAFAGAYQLGPRFVLRVTSQADHLIVQATDQPPVPFRPTAERTFEAKAIGAKIAFTNGGLVLTQGGADRPGRRISTDQAAQIEAQPKTVERKVAKVDPALYDRFTGVYRLPGERIVEVLREGERLFAKFTNTPKVELFPESERKFFLQVPGFDVQATFAEGPKAASVTVHQGGLDTVAPRIN